MQLNLKMRLEEKRNTREIMIKSFQIKRHVFPIQQEGGGGGVSA